MADAGTAQSWEIEKGAVLQEMRNLRIAFDSLNDAVRGHGTELTALKVEHVTMQGKLSNTEARLSELKSDFEGLRKWGMGIVGSFITAGGMFLFAQYIHSIQQIAK